MLSPEKKTCNLCQAKKLEQISTNHNYAAKNIVWIWHGWYLSFIKESWRQRYKHKQASWKGIGSYRWQFRSTTSDTQQQTISEPLYSCVANSLPNRLIPPRGNRNFPLHIYNVLQCSFEIEDLASSMKDGFSLSESDWCSLSRRKLSFYLWTVWPSTCPKNKRR